MAGYKGAPKVDDAALQLLFDHCYPDDKWRPSPGILIKPTGTIWRAQLNFCCSHTHMHSSNCVDCQAEFWRVTRVPNPADTDGGSHP